MSSNRCKLNKDLNSAEFKEYYFLKEELKEFCRNEGLKISGSKNQLEERIIYYLDTGKSLDDEKPIQNKSNFQKSNPNKTTDFEEIRLDSLLGENFKCSEDKREFFEREIGKGFKFNVKFQKWLKENPDKTYQEAINAYHELQNS
ncbi:MAG: SAP domain-containing protein, partial [Methanobrevibacter sp.]|nr:SAP domain-containing protein [Methanobrevibacter sp.]